MKSLWIASAFLLSYTVQSYAQSEKELQPGYYVVVGAYSANRENVAQNYTEVLNLKGVKARYGFNTSKNFYFVYLDYLAELKPALKEMYKRRQSVEFPDAWVRVVRVPVGTAANEVLISPAETPPTAKAQTADPVVNAGDTKQESQPETQSIDSAVATTPTSAIDSLAIAPNEEIKQFDVMTLGNTEVFLSLFNARNNKIVEGRVKVIDTEKNKLLKEVDGNDYMFLPDPNTTSGTLTLICEAFGYRKVQQEINYPLPLADTVKDYVELLGTTFIVYFDLNRYQIGDRATLYNVYFFNDAAIMLPESKFELTSLLEMMTENPDYKVRLHGHTNGNYHGRIVKMGSAKNFFSLEGSVNSIGSAKDLSFARADVIKQYLVANGIKPDRIEVKAWGGKKPLYDKHSANARRNVRVEVEVLED
jgi:outer membrane protein OmpA-like peptidoglycan-associated protein